ncbi:MAG TPA: hypothetical protein VF644_10590 [Pyrinomonadaceae bacterium]|jgi:hypothetical protein
MSLERIGFEYIISADTARRELVELERTGAETDQTLSRLENRKFSGQTFFGQRPSKLKESLLNQ